jgi:hypothetical protein
MILVLGVWTFLRALLGGATAVALETVALRQQLVVRSGQSLGLGYAGGTASSGSASPGFGRTGGLALSSSAPPPSLPGTAKASNSTGAGNRGPPTSPAGVMPK